MNDNLSTKSSSDNHLTALQVISSNMINVIQNIADLYKQQHAMLNPESLITINCDWLNYIISQKINGDKLHIQQLINDTMIEHLDKGRSLYRLVSQHNEKDNIQINELVQEHGLTIVPVVKLSQIFSNLIKEMLGLKPHSKKGFSTIKQLHTSEIQNIFDDSYANAVNEISAIGITNPLIFFLENVSIILGWLAGFFAQMCNKSDQLFLEESLLLFEKP